MTFVEQPVCPQCGAVARPDARWCTLCLAALGPEEPPSAGLDPLTAPLEDVLRSSAATPDSQIPGPVDPSTATVAGSPGAALDALAASPVLLAETPAPQIRRGGRHAAAPADALDTAASPAPSPAPPTAPVAGLDPDTVDAMLAMLAAEHAKDDAAAPVVGLLQDKSTRLFAIMGGILVMTAVFFIVIAVLGAFT